MNILARFLRLLARVARRLRCEFRNRYYRCLFKHLGKGCNICDGVMITTPQNISLGNYVQINERVILQANEAAPIDIGNYVAISYDVMILTAGLDWTKGFEAWKHYCFPVIIEDQVWIGARAIILPGVTIGKGALVAAGSVVTKDVAPNTLVAGIPARVVRELTPALSAERENRNG